MPTDYTEVRDISEWFPDFSLHNGIAKGGTEIIKAMLMADGKTPTDRPASTLWWQPFPDERPDIWLLGISVQIAEDIPVEDQLASRGGYVAPDLER